MLQTVLSALLNVLLLAGLPFLVYALYQRRKHGRSWRESMERAGLRLGDLRYVGYCFAVGAVALAFLLFWFPPADVLAREGSAFEAFRGLGLGTRTAVAALLYGVVQTGFAEELLFRGLIAGSLSRRLPLIWANLLQALLFLLPHLLILLVAPELGAMLLVIFASALFAGWARIRSGSILGPWLLHALVNVTTALLVAARTAG